MDKYLRPSRFEVDANATGADKQLSHWYKTFSNFLDAIAEHEPDKLVTLTNYVAPNVQKLKHYQKQWENGVFYTNLHKI